jgi:hypothetical protein
MIACSPLTFVALLTLRSCSFSNVYLLALELMVYLLSRISFSIPSYVASFVLTGCLLAHSLPLCSPSPLFA